MDFAQPWCLLLLPVIGTALWLGMRRSLTGWDTRRMAASLAMRAAILLLLTLALAGLRWRMPARGLGVLFVVDASASITKEQAAQAREFITRSLSARGAHDTAGAVAFAQSAALWSAHLDEAPKDAPPSVGKPDRTDTGAALEFARAILPADKTGRVVLLSDGNDTESHAMEAARRLAAGDAALFTVPLTKPELPEVLVEKIAAPGRPASGEPFTASATLRSNVATKARVRLYQNQFVVRDAERELKPGVNVIAFDDLRAEGTFVALEAEVTSPADTLAQNNRAKTLLTLRGEPRVLLVDTDTAKIAPLAAALRAQKINVEVRPPVGLPTTLDDLQQFDLFILSDVPALSLTGAQMELYRRWVRELGGGFIMAGGENSFGAGGWFRTPVEAMLPVRMEHADRVEAPVVALLVVLDRSGSMAAKVDGVTKISLANQGAVLAMNVLQSRDLFGLFAVDSRVHTVVPLARLDNRAAAEQKTLAITSSGGGIYIYTSLVEAFQTLRDAQASVKHVILFSDAADAEEKSAGEMGDSAGGSGTAMDVVTAMLAAKITTSVVALGLDTDKDTEFLRALAARGGGRFYLTGDARTLPQIFTTETSKVAQSSLVEEPFRAVPATALENSTLKGIDWAQSPFLLGCNATKPKPTADILLATGRGEPLLASWRFGLGTAAAFTSDAKARWASEWLAWPGFGKFWSQLARTAMRKGGDETVQVTASEEGDRLRVRVESVNPDGTLRSDREIAVSAAAPGSDARQLAATQTAPGIFEAACELPEEGSTLVSVSSAGKDARVLQVLAHTRSHPREFIETGVNTAALERLAEEGGGRFAPAPADVFAPPRHPRVTLVDLTDYLLAAALLLFPLDILLRRRG
jgi:uncharacterized membrane protein